MLNKKTKIFFWLCILLFNPIFSNGATYSLKSKNIGISFNFGYLNLNTSGISSFLDNRGYKSAINGYISGGNSISLDMGKLRYILGYQVAIPSYDDNYQNFPEYYSIDQYSIYSAIGFPIIQYKKFRLYFDVGYDRGYQTLSLVTSGLLPNNFQNAVSNVRGVTNMFSATHYLSAGLNPEFIIYDHPGSTVNMCALSLNFKYSLDVNDSDWLDISNNVVSDVPENRFNAFETGFFTCSVYF